MNKKSYSNFKFEDLKMLKLEITEEKVFVPIPDEIPPSDFLKKSLEIYMEVPLATEKAKSELIITPILNDLRIRNPQKFTYFSGYNFEVDSKQGLKGFCDFILTKAPKTPFIEKPILAIVEAKNAEIETGIPQCIAEMYAAQLFNNRRENNDIFTIFGTVTSGFDWLFLSLCGNQVKVDTHRYFVNDLAPLIGVLNYIVNN